VRSRNDLVGEMAAIDGTPRSAAAVALATVDVHLIEAIAFEKFVRTNDNVAWMLLRSMAERQRDTDQRRVDQATASVAKRVAVALVDMADRVAGTGDPSGAFVVSQAELAESVAATREAVAKALAELRKSGAIETARRRMRVLDREKLLESARR
jgi:CRP-like cAMP-binding protein